MQIPNKEYWQKRFEALEAIVHKNGLAVYSDIEKQYIQAMQAIDKELAAWYKKFMEGNQVSFYEAKKLLTNKELKEFHWTVEQYIEAAEANDLSTDWQRKLNNASSRVHVSRLEAFLLQLQQHLEVLFGNQLDSLDAALANQYQDSYYQTAFTIQQGVGIGHSFNQLDTNKIELALTKPWATDDKNFSDRIWEHKAKLMATLTQEMTQAIIRGDDYRRATNNIAKRMDVSKHAAGRLVMTESAFIASKGQQDCFKELGVEQYKFIATLDSHTSDTCRHMDGKVFKMSDFKPGTTAPPLHCYCRSCTAPYFADDEKAERIARGKDGKNYKVPADMTYRQWKEKYVAEFLDLDRDYKTYTMKELQAIAESQNKVLDKYTDEPSIWNGKVEPTDRGVNYASWTHEIRLMQNNIPDVILHELIHMRSVSRYNGEIYAKHGKIEESTVQLLTQEITWAEGHEVTGSGYDDMVNILRGLNKKHGLFKTDLLFAQNLLKIPPQDRIDYLKEKLYNKLMQSDTATFEDIAAVDSELEQLTGGRTE